ncbi:hypothetical protein [Humisphaera borealis]|uniref:Uncharacterized protein n=1 Tax=Humisphaera borealis TaxID=2807512 RepID=A0A7M2X046_9BACT|nr:hypothetical protein [Humisphaera borealis]QOV91014.1 hypothetical protein IPV69_06545 [Humisphaera borealis]
MSKRADYAAISKAVVEAVERRYMLSGAPAIVHFDYRDGAQIRTDNGFDVSFEFDAPIANVSTSAIEITDVNNPQSVIRPSSISRQATSLSARVGVGPGSYVIRVRSGEGFVEGVDGQDLDGEYNGENAFSGDEVAGGDFVFGVTVLPFATPPTAPHDVRAYPLSSGAIEVHYRLDQESGYGISVERAEGDGAFVVIHSSPFPLGSGYEGVFAYIDSAVEADKTYRYRVSQNFYVGNEPARSTPSEEVVAQVLPSSLDVPIASVAAIGGLHPDWLTPLGTRLFYSLNNPEIRTDWRTTGSTGLWVTDSSGSPPVQLYNAPVRELIAFNGKLFFSGYAAQTGWELYCSDGTVEGTSLFKEIESGSGSFPIRMIAASSDFLFFGVNRSATGYEIWKTNGSAEGTVKATDALAFLDESRNTSASSRRLATISDHGSSLYFRKANADGSDAGQLWRLLGATGETSQIAGAVHPEWLTDLNGSLYFKGRTGVFATEYNPPLHKFGLYKVESDTAALLSTTGPDEQNYSFFYRMERVGNQLFFEATGRTSPNETIWVSDGTAAGTKPLRNPLGGNQLHLHGIQDVNGVAYMIAVYAGGNFNSAGVVLKSDGTDRGTKLFRDFRGTTDDETQLFAQSAANHYVYTDGLKVWLTGDTRESGRQIGVFGPTFEAGVRFGNVSASIGDALFFTTRVDPYTRDLRLANLTPPAAPSSLTTSPTGGGVGAGTGAGGIGLSWADNANNERGYTLDRYAPGATLPEATVQLPLMSQVLPTRPASLAVHIDCAPTTPGDTRHWRQRHFRHCKPISSTLCPTRARRRSIV